MALSCATVVPHFIRCHITFLQALHHNFCNCRERKWNRPFTRPIFLCGEKWSGNKTTVYVHVRAYVCIHVVVRACVCDSVYVCSIVCVRVCVLLCMCSVLLPFLVFNVQQEKQGFRKIISVGWLAHSQVYTSTSQHHCSRIRTQSYLLSVLLVLDLPLS